MPRLKKNIFLSPTPAVVNTEDRANNAPLVELR
jgi:hypothetical protein